MNENTVFDIVAPPILTLIFGIICYLWARTARRGKPLTRLQRGMLLYATTFALGMVYLILFQDRLGALLHWKDSWIVALVMWGTLLAIVAWWRNRTSPSGDVPSEN